MKLVKTFSSIVIATILASSFVVTSCGDKDPCQEALDDFNALMDKALSSEDMPAFLSKEGPAFDKKHYLRYLCVFLFFLYL